MLSLEYKSQALLLHQLAW